MPYNKSSYNNLFDDTWWIITIKVFAAIINSALDLTNSKVPNLLEL